MTDKLKSYTNPIKQMCSDTDHRNHKGLNNRAENTHQPTRRKKKCLIKFKSPQGLQHTLSLMGKVRNIFALDVAGYINNARKQRDHFQNAKSIWHEAMQLIAAA